MNTFESDPEYMELLHRLRAPIAGGAEVSGNPMDAVMCVADLAAEVLIGALDREQWEGGAGLLIERLYNTLDRRAAKQAQ